MATERSFYPSTLNIMALEHERVMSGECNEYIWIHIGRGKGRGRDRGVHGGLLTLYLPTPYPLSPVGGPRSETNETLVCCSNSNADTGTKWQ